MSKRAERLITKIYQETFKKVFTKQRLSQASQGQKQTITSTILQLQNSQQFDEFAKKFAKKLSLAALTNQKGIWRKYYQAAKEKHIGVLPDTYRKFELQILQKVVENNFKMIKSVPQHILSVYEQKDVDILIQQVVKGKLGRKSFEKELKSHAYKNAKMIARTETSKLQTAITQQRSTSLGSVCYEWVSSNDRRTRLSHRQMNNVIVFWKEQNEKPLLDKMRGNAGEFPNCRCDTRPIFDENDLTKSNYKVYDYRYDKIITLSKKELLESIQKGGL